LALVEVFETANNPQQRRFTASAGTQKGKEFTVLDGKGYAIERSDAIVIFPYGPNVDCGRSLIGERATMSQCAWAVVCNVAHTDRSSIQEILCGTDAGCHQAGVLTFVRPS
jgi:hypothetical protein